MDLKYFAPRECKLITRDLLSFNIRSKNNLVDFNFRPIMTQVRTSMNCVRLKNKKKTSKTSSNYIFK